MFAPVAASPVPEGRRMRVSSTFVAAAMVTAVETVSVPLVSMVEREIRDPGAVNRTAALKLWRTRVESSTRACVALLPHTPMLKLALNPRANATIAFVRKLVSGAASVPLNWRPSQPVVESTAPNRTGVANCRQIRRLVQSGP